MIRALAGALSLYWVGWIFYAKWLHPLAKFPGPALAAVSRLWVVLHVARGKAEAEQRQLHEKYGGYSWLQWDRPELTHQALSFGLPLTSSSSMTRGLLSLSMV